MNYIPPLDVAGGLTAALATAKDSDSTGESSLIVFPNEDVCTDLGGKGNGLRLLARAGLPVPDFFVLLFTRPSQGAVCLSPQTLLDLKKAAERIGPPWVARSSASAEDGPLDSFAGLFRTQLNLVTFSQLETAIADCCGALTSEKVQAYCYRKQLPLPQKLHVVIQRFIPSRVSGVAFTRDPVNPSRRAIVVESTLGIGTTVVGGSVTPDRWYTDAEGRDILEKTLGSKRIKDVVNQNRIVRLKTSPLERDTLSLQETEVLDVANFARAAEKAIMVPADIEWAADEHKMWLLQARPMTSLSENQR